MLDDTRSLAASFPSSTGLRKEFRQDNRSVHELYVQKIGSRLVHDRSSVSWMVSPLSCLMRRDLLRLLFDPAQGCKWGSGKKTDVCMSYTTDQQLPWLGTFRA